MRAVALILTVVTGGTGLVYEVAWQKYLATLLGSHSEATAAVLGIFLAGLSIGYWLFGRVSREIVARAAAAGKAPKLLTSYGLIEAGIGIYALLFPGFFALVQSLSLRIPQDSGGVGFALDVVLAALLIALPTILMGGTIPLLTQALARNLADATRFHAFVYAFNTAGAFFGALAAGFVLVPWLGLSSVMFAMGAINLGVGLTFVALGMWRRGIGPVPESSSAARPEGFAWFVLVALLCGFAMMVVQTVLNRIGALAFGSSPFTFSMIVAVFVLCIAVGSFLVAALPRIRPLFLLLDLLLLFLALYLIYPFIENAPFWAHVLRTSFSATSVAFYLYYLAALLSIFAILGPAVVLSGATLPLIFHHLRGRSGDLGALAGVLYSWNTVGSLAGALLGGYLLLFWLDLHEVYRLALAALGIATVILLMRLYQMPRLASVVALAGVAGSLVLLEPWDSRNLSAGLFRVRTLMPVRPYLPDRVVDSLHQRTLQDLYDVDDPINTVAVREIRDDDGRRVLSIFNNGKSEGTTGRIDRPTMGLAALLPALFADKLERVFVIGYGTGVTIGELAALRSSSSVVVAEISPGVIDAAPLFDPENLNASKNPKVRILRSDAYRALMRSETRYDAIVSEPSNPWVAGVEMLYSREFLEAARSRLAPGGVFLQWYHQYETDQPSVELVLRTYATVFGEVSVWYGSGPDLLLVGFPERGRSIDLDRLERRARQPDVAAGMRRMLIEGFPELLAHELLPTGVLHAAKLEGPLHTLYHPRLTHQAGFAFFAGTPASLPFTGFGEPARVGSRNSLVRRHASRSGGVLPDSFYAALVGESCIHRATQCVALLADWQVSHPTSEAFEKELRSAQQLSRTRFGQKPSRQAVMEVAALLRGEAPAPQPAGVRPIAAQRATEAFRAYFQHSVEFDGSRLLRLWTQCRAPRARAMQCENGRKQARTLLQVGNASSIGPQM